MLTAVNKDAWFVPFRRTGSCSDSFAGFTQHGVDQIGDFGDMPQVYARIISGYSTLRYDELLAALRRCKKRSTGELLTHHYSHYYTDETREMVLDADRDYIDRFGYSFEEET